MAGKTVYLKQIALVQVLAQMGSFIPAQSGSVVKMMDHLFFLSAPGSNSSTQADDCSQLENSLQHAFYMLKAKSGSQTNLQLQ